MTPMSRRPAEETEASDDLKVVVSIKGGRATIGVQQPSSDPHIETFDDLDVSGLTQEVSAVVERARARWEDTPKHPAPRQARSPGQAPEPARAGGGAGGVYRNVGRDAGTTADAEAVLSQALCRLAEGA